MTVDSPPALLPTSSAAAGRGSFDAAKVARIAQAIREGRYVVDADAIADKLIANAEAMLSRNIETT